MTNEEVTSTTFIKDNSVSDSYYYNGKIKPIALARCIFNQNRNRYNFVVTREDKEIWRYNGNGYYIPDGERFICNQVQQTLDIHSSIHIKNEVISYVKDMADIQISYNDFNSKPKLINLQNGVYDLDSGEFKEHDYNYLFTNKLPITYNPEATCPNIKKFLSEILDEKDIPIIQELVGYLLLKDYRFHKAFMFIGSGRNGKSTLINLLTRFVGKENVSNVDLQSLDTNRFSAMNLYHKLLNAHSDISSKALRLTGLFKQLTGEDMIMGDRKFQEPIQFNNYAKMVFSCNELPMSQDDTVAFYSRWILLEFNNQFIGNDCNPNLIESLTTEEEISGLFNWCIEGLERLLKMGKFSFSDSTNRVKERWIQHSHPLLAFINNRAEIKPEYEVSKTEIYEEYKNYCADLDVSPIVNNVFSRELKKYVRKIDEVSKHIDGKHIKFWKGIRLKVAELDKYPTK